MQRKHAHKLTLVLESCYINMLSGAAVRHRKAFVFLLHLRNFCGSKAVLGDGACAISSLPAPDAVQCAHRDIFALIPCVSAKVAWQMHRSRRLAAEEPTHPLAQVVREHYLRDDIWSGSPLDPESDPACNKLSVGAREYLVVDTNVVLQQVRQGASAGGERGAAQSCFSKKKNHSFLCVPFTSHLPTWMYDQFCVDKEKVSMPLQMDFLEHSAVEDVIIMGVVLEEVCRSNPCLQIIPCLSARLCLCVFNSLRASSSSSRVMVIGGVCAHAETPAHDMSCAAREQILRRLHPYPTARNGVCAGAASQHLSVPAPARAHRVAQPPLLRLLK